MDRITELMESSVVMGISRPTQDEYNIPIDPRIDINELTKDDSDPMFVNVEVLRTGTSKTNNRVYTNDIVESTISQIPGLLGFLGHPDPSKHGFEFRDPQCVYVGAVAEPIEGGLVRAVGKAYLFKTSPLREWIPKSIAAGNPLTVSINGTGDVFIDPTSGLVHVRVVRLESIDWANPGTEGVGTAQAINIVTELQGGNKEMPEVITKTPELIKSITISEMKAHNAELVDAIVKDMTIAELQGKNPDLFNKIVADNRITEMSLKIDGQDKAVKIEDVQMVIDARDQKIAELQGQIDGAKITEYKNSKLAEIPEQFREKISGRVVGNTNAEIDASILSEVTYIKEMIGNDTWDNLPKGNTVKHTDDMTSAMKSLFRVEEKK